MNLYRLPSHLLRLTSPRFFAFILCILCIHVSTVICVKRSDAFGDFGLDLFVLGEAAFLYLGEGEFTVNGDFELPTPGRNEREALNVLFELSEESVRQTDGLVFVASSCTIFDVDSGHLAPP